MLKKILFGVVFLALVAVLVVQSRPDTFTVSRSIGIATPPDVPYAAISDFHRWSSFSPWAKLDPHQKETYSGAPSGTGAIYEWDGNDDVGAGRMLITGVKPNERVDIALSFIRPFASQSEVSFLVQPTGSETKVTWQMVGHANFMSKAFGLFVDMDAMLGKDFDAGLAALKTVAEADLAKAMAEKRAAEEKAAAEAAAAAAAAAPAPAEAAQAAIPPTP